jgi:Zn-dependent oligopeptidase
MTTQALWIHWNMNADKILTDTNKVITRSIQNNNLIKKLDIDDNVRKILSIAIDDATEYTNICSIIGFLKICVGDDDTLSACNEAQDLLLKHNYQIMIDRILFERYNNLINHTKEFASDELSFINKVIENYKKYGIDKNDKMRENLHTVDIHIQRYENDIINEINNENKNVRIHQNLVGNIPIDIRASFQKDSDGNYVIDMTSNLYSYCMNYIDDSNARKNLELTKGRLCRQNVSRLMKLFALRIKKAKIIGYDSYSDFALENCLLNNSKAVKDILYNVADKTLPRYIREIKELMRIKKKLTPSNDRKVEVWDIDFLTNIWRKQYGVNDNDVRYYFPIEHVISEIIHIYEELFGIKISKSDDITWDNKVKSYVVSNKGKLEGVFFIDLYARDTKQRRNHCINIQPGCEYPYGKNKQLNQSVLIANFTNNVTILNYQDVIFLFHEMAHIMHNILGSTRISQFSGTNAERDFVEIPALVLEKLCWEPSIIRRLSSHYVNGTHLPDSIVRKMIKSRNMNIGINYRRNIFFALYDQMVHSSDKFFGLCERILMSDESDDNINDAMYDIYRQSFNQVFKLDFIENGKYNLEMIHDNFPPAFSPSLILGNECHNYNSIWSEVCATDIYYDKFKSDPLNTANGKEFIDTIFGKKGNVNNMDNIIDYLHRKPTIDNFLLYNDMASDEAEYSIFFNGDNTQSEIDKMKTSSNNNSNNPNNNKHEALDSESTLINASQTHQDADKNITVIDSESDSDDDTNRFTEAKGQFNDDASYITENTETLKRYKNIFTKKPKIEI